MPKRTITDASDDWQQHQQDHLGKQHQQDHRRTLGLHYQPFWNEALWTRLLRHPNRFWHHPVRFDDPTVDLCTQRAVAVLSPSHQTTFNGSAVIRPSS